MLSKCSPVSLQMTGFAQRSMIALATFSFQVSGSFLALLASLIFCMVSFECFTLAFMAYPFFIKRLLLDFLSIRINNIVSNPTIYSLHRVFLVGLDTSIIKNQVLTLQTVIAAFNAFAVCFRHQHFQCGDQRKPIPLIDSITSRGGFSSWRITTRSFSILI